MMPSSVQQTVIVRVPAKLSLDQAHKVVANVLGKLGCPACFSGFDIRFAHIRDLVVDAKSLEIRELGG
jgi:hypothetical protein